MNKVVYITSAKGERIPISISTAALKDAQGKTIGGVESFRDLRVVNELFQHAEQQDSFSEIIGRSAFDEAVVRPLARDSRERQHGAHRRPERHGQGAVRPRYSSAFASARKTICRSKLRRAPGHVAGERIVRLQGGAFTDARKDKPGRFALAEGGSLFLDEIGDVSPAMQTRLLRVLQERVYEPLGGLEPVRCDVRVIAASNRLLATLVKEGKFREDLYYRVHVVQLELPPLRERREDLPLLIDHFVAGFNRLKGRDVAGVSDSVLARLMEYEFPGNVRELENIIERAFVLCRSGLIELSHLPPQLRGSDEEDHSGLLSGLTLEAVEKRTISAPLRRSNGNRASAARELGIDVSTLFRKIKAMEIRGVQSGRDPEPKRGSSPTRGASHQRKRCQ